MNKRVFILLGILAFTVSSISPSFASQEDTMQYIILFSKQINDQAKKHIIEQVGGKHIKKLSHGEDVAILPGRAAERALRNNGEVISIEEDTIVGISAKPLGGSTQPPQTLPWGINRVHADAVWPTGNTADAIRVGIIDTGISLTHPDLAGNIKGGVNTINTRKGPNDDNGHGSHVAGTIAGLNNTIGVVGVAPQVDLYAVKVLGSNGMGYTSDVIEGIDWSIANNMDVINMSLGSSVNNSFLHDAVVRAYNAGVVIVAAAGNSGGAVEYPGAYNEVIGVSATDQHDAIASFSSRGPEVDIAAPGVSVLSAYKGTGYATLSGTSMATPHVAGVAALVLNSAVGTNDINGNGKWDPAEVKQRLQGDAVDLGNVGHDDLFGAGLVQAL